MTDRCPRCSAELATAANYCARCGAFVSIVPGAPAPDAAETRDALIGTVVLGRYRVVRLLGEGGMGKVYLAEQSMGQATRPVALKMLRRELTGDPRVSGRFLRESEIVIRLAHPNTIQFYDFGQLDDGSMVIVMEYIEGHSLSDELHRGPLSLARIDALMTQICGSLAEAHAHGIVHRDIKPQNVLLTSRAGQSDFVKVLDFGIAMRRSQDEPDPTRLTRHGTLVGTPPYMSPEQFQDRDVDARSDVYSLGVVLYQLLTGELPFEAKSAWQWAAAHIDLPPKPLGDHPRTSDLPQQRVQAVMRALAKDPAERPSDAAELLREFTGSDTQRPSGSGRTDDAGSTPLFVAPAKHAEPNRPSRSPWLSWLPIALVAGAGAVITWRSAQVAPDVTVANPTPGTVSASATVKRVTDTRTTPRGRRERGERAMKQPVGGNAAVTTTPVQTSAADAAPAYDSEAEAALTRLRSALQQGQLDPGLASLRSAQTRLPTDHTELAELRVRLAELAAGAAKSLGERGECEQLRRLAEQLSESQVGDPTLIHEGLEECEPSTNSPADAGGNSAIEE
jgi:serine/threonine protein kinase